MHGSAVLVHWLFPDGVGPEQGELLTQVAMITSQFGLGEDVRQVAFDGLRIGGPDVETDRERAARHERERLESHERHERERLESHERHERERLSARSGRESLNA